MLLASSTSISGYAHFFQTTDLENLKQKHTFSQFSDFLIPTNMMMMFPFHNYGVPKQIVESNDRNSNDESIGHLKALHDTVQAASPRMSPTSTPATSLGVNFQPGPNDVVCARGKEAFLHPGNKMFRELVAGFTTAYESAPNKAQRSVIVSDIIEKVRSMGNGFVRKEKDGEWHTINDKGTPDHELV